MMMMMMMMSRPQRPTEPPRVYFWILLYLRFLCFFKHKKLNYTKIMVFMVSYISHFFASSQLFLGERTKNIKITQISFISKRRPHIAIHSIDTILYGVLLYYYYYYLLLLLLLPQWCISYFRSFV